MNQHKLVPLIDLLLTKAQQLKLINPRDLIYLRNHYAILLNLKSLEHGSDSEFSANLDQQQHSIADVLNLIYQTLDKAQQAALGNSQEQIETRLIAALLPLPSQIEAKFQEIHTQNGIKAALDWYYQFSQDTDYIKTAAIAKNKSWTGATSYGDFEITINLSKPEKDPAEIAKAKHAPASSYPKCLLCIENEGYSGNSLTQPARHNHRMLRLKLSQEQEYYFQYSPYLYYNEHSIIINPQHCDMVINQQTFANFFAFVNQVPDYLIGSNSDIPIVGGSILTHDHYQAGNHVFPIENAQIKASYTLTAYPQVQLNYLHWPVSTLQLIGNQVDLTALAALVLKKWYAYNNPELDILASSELAVRHNAVTPILRKLAPDKYALYLLLRNNRCNAEYPDGIFHPHRELHHIKKENIGLIEAMGLAILPGRLDYELAEIEKLLLLNDLNLALSELLFDEKLLKHEAWFIELYEKHAKFSKNTIRQMLQTEVALKFCQVLENSGVFKANSDGDAGLHDFIQQLEHE
jgi:UDPglucose--hexose-1-phosphate uridylyltransferase